MSRRGELEKELRALRARAYGPSPDIDDDPVALARLAELEEIHSADAHAVADPDSDMAPAPRPPVPATAEATGSTGASPVDRSESPSGRDRPGLPGPTEGIAEPGSDTFTGSSPSAFWRRATSTRARRVAWAAGAVAGVVAVVYAVSLLAAPRPDATLHQIGDEPDTAVYRVFQYAGPLQIDYSTLQTYEQYRGIELWSGQSAFGSPCLTAIDRSRFTVIAASCVPESADLFIDIGAWPGFPDDYAAGLPDGSVIRFRLNGDVVEAFVILAADE